MPKKITYVPMPGSRLSKEKAAIAGAELTRIEKKAGSLNPKIVVEAAEPEEAPLHPFFTWNDEKAAKLYREEQARHLIRSIRVVTVDVPPQEQPVIRLFSHVTATEDETKFQGEAYINTPRAMKKDSYRQQLLADAMNNLRLWENRYRDLHEFKPVFEAIEEIKHNFKHADA